MDKLSRIGQVAEFREVNFRGWAILDFSWEKGRKRAKFAKIYLEKVYPIKKHRAHAWSRIKSNTNEGLLLLVSQLSDWVLYHWKSKRTYVFKPYSMHLNDMDTIYSVSPSVYLEFLVRSIGGSRSTVWSHMEPFGFTE